MNTLSGYSKYTLSDKYVLTADGGDKYFPIDLKSAYTGNGEGWYRIATSIKGIYNCEGTFEIYGAVAGRHTTCTITAGTSYGSNNSSHITLLHCSLYSTANPAISSIRIVYHSTYTNNYAYLEVYKPGTSNVNIKVNLVNGFGWTLTNPNTVGEIPSGYTSKELALISGNIATTGFTILNSNNSSVTGGDSSITVKINDVEKTLTIPANTDEKVAYTANTSNVAHPILFANNSTSTGTPTTGAVYYETNSTNSPGLTYNPYSDTLNTKILNIYNGGHIKINAAIKDHNNPMDLCLCIATPTASTDLTIKNSPGIGFKVEGKNWASMIFNHVEPCFEFINSSATADVNIKAAQLVSSIATGHSPLKVTSTTLVSNLNADMLDGEHAHNFAKCIKYNFSFEVVKNTSTSKLEVSPSSMSLNLDLAHLNDNNIPSITLVKPSLSDYSLSEYSWYFEVTMYYDIKRIINIYSPHLVLTNIHEEWKTWKDYWMEFDSNFSVAAAANTTYTFPVYILYY